MRILFTSTQDAPFIRDDLSYLQKSHVVHTLTTRGLRSLPSIISGVYRAESTFTWFASVYAGIIVFVARLFRRKSVVVVGGVDAAYEPGYGYGIWRSRWRSVLVRYAMKHADVLLAVTPFLRDQAIKLARYDGANIHVVPTGYDPTMWTPDGSPRDPVVLTVASCETVPRMTIKGIPFLVETARMMPGTRFLLIGPRQEALAEIRRLDPPPNLSLLPSMPREALVTYYRNSSVYCQPSYYEGGLGSSLCEAMLCGCVPVGTTVGGIPDAVGDTGFLVPFGDSPRLQSALQEALASPPEVRERARNRIADLYTVQRREESLDGLIGRILP